MDSLVQFFKNLGTGRLIVISIAGVVTFSFFAFVLGRLQTAPMSVLFSDLEVQQASEVVARLEAEQIPYETGLGGRIIRVPEDQVDRLRISLAGEGLTGSVIGKEIFDQDTSFGRTSFELNVNYVRAIEGELSRTITHIGGVREARVHIVMPERRPFQRELSQPSASILLTTGGGGLGKEQVRAIQALVASAVTGMTSDQVTITDSSGRLLSDGTRGSAANAISFMEEARLAKEDLYRNKIQSLLASSVGYGNVRAEVSLEMETSRVNTKETRYDPEGQVTLSTNVSEASDQDRSRSSQVTVGNSLPEAGEQSSDSNPTSSSNSTTEVTNFQNSLVETVTVREPGQITKLRVSVVVNDVPQIGEGGAVTGYTPRSDAELAKFRSLIQSAVPFDIDRDGADAITVVSMQFVDPPNTEALAPAFNLFGLNKQDLVDLVQQVGLIISVILVLVLVVRPIVTRVVEAIPDASSGAASDTAQLEGDSAQPAPAIAGPDMGLSPELLALAANGDSAARNLVAKAKASGSLQLANMGTDAKIDVARLEGQIQESTIKKVSEIIRGNPSDSTAIVRSWLYAE